jgi:hypothetical protein
MKANLTDENRFARQGQRAYSAKSPLVILAILVVVIGIGFFMLLLTH